jgi:hypothetical protein
VKIIQDAEKIAKQIGDASITQITGLSQVLSSLPYKGRANLLHLKEFLEYQASRKNRWAGILLREMVPYFDGTYEEMEYLLGYLSWEIRYMKGGR